MCEQLAQGSYLKADRPGLEPATLLVQRPNSYTARPHTNETTLCPNKNVHLLFYE